MRGTVRVEDIGSSDLHSNVVGKENCEDFIGALSRSKSAVQLIKKFEERLPIVAEKKPRNVVAIDETVVKANGEKYYVYAAIENELILMKVYPSRNSNYSGSPEILRE